MWQTKGFAYKLYDQQFGEAMKSRIVILGLTILTLPSLGCSISHRVVSDAKTTEDGNIIVYEWTAYEGKRHAVLKSGYGLMIFYNVFEKNPVIRFDLFVHETKRLIRTTGLNHFRRELSKITPGATLHYYNTCGPGTHHAMDPSVIEEIRVSCQEKGIAFQEGDDELLMICTCF